MITFTRIRTVMRDGWSVSIPTINTLHDSSLGALINYTAALGYIKPGDKYKIINNFNDVDNTPSRVQIRVYNP